MRAGTANFSKIHSMILGTTPLKTKSQRRLFGTPAVTSQAVAATTPVPTSVASSPITATTKAGTLVKHVKLAEAARSEQLGVVVGTTVSDTSKVDILWTTDGKTEGMAPQLLSAYTVPTPSNPAPTTAPASTLQPALQRQYISSYRSVISAKFPKDLVCPLTSIDEEEIQKYQLRLDSFVFAAHPRLRLLMTGDLEQITSDLKQRKARQDKAKQITSNLTTTTTNTTAILLVYTPWQALSKITVGVGGKHCTVLNK